MLVIQIIDKSETRRVELGDQPLLIGSDPGCDLVFTESGLSPEHLACKPSGRDQWQFRVLRGKGILLNGKPLREGEFTRGDRLTIGSICLEVLETAHRYQPATSAGSPRSRRGVIRRSGSRQRPPWELVGLLGAIVLVMIVYGIVADSGPSVSVELARLVYDLEEWRLDKAGKSLESLRSRVGDGGGSQAERLRQLNVEYDSRRQAQAQAESFMEGFWQQAEGIGHLRLTAIIRDRIQQAHKNNNKLMADYLDKKCLIGLRDKYLARVGDSSGKRAKKFTEGQQARIPVSEVMFQIDQMMREGRIMASLQLLENCSAEAGSLAAAADYKGRRKSILKQLDNRMHDVCYQAINLANQGDARKGLLLLNNLANLVPVITELSTAREKMVKLVRDIGKLAVLAGGNAVARAARPKKPGTSIDWGKVAKNAGKEKKLATSRPSAAGSFKQAVLEEEKWNFAVAKQLFASLVDRYPAAAERAEKVGFKVAFLAGLTEAIKASPESFSNIRLADNELARVVAASQDGFTMLDNGQEVVYPWPVMGLAGVLSMGGRAGLSGAAQLGFAALALDGGKDDEFDKILFGATAREPGLLEQAGSMLEQRTGKKGPFCWHLEKWMPCLEKQELVRLEELAKELKLVMVERDMQKRTIALRKLASQGALAKGAVVKGIEEILFDRVNTLRDDNFFRIYDKVAEVRRELDKRREHALDLIFDEVKFFYPYKPPECPPEKAKLYPAVVREMTKRVDAVAWAWKKTVKARISRSLRKQIDEALWLYTQLRFLSEDLDPVLIDQMDVVYRLPLDLDAVDIRSFAWTVAGQRRLYYDRRVMRFNLVAEIEPTVVEMDQIQITNEYRLMMGRRALVVNQLLLRSARNHSKEMSLLGYFSHFSPVAKNRTPFIRMRNEGYGKGVSENIARGLGPQGAHDRWLLSSGHHRNILQSGHTEFGSGCEGNIWTQNFGRGEGFKQDPLFEQDTIFKPR